MKIKSARLDIELDRFKWEGKVLVVHDSNILHR